MTFFYIKQNDTAPALQVQLLEDDNLTPIVLTSASAVVFNMRNSSGGILVSRGLCTIVDAATGVVEYPWQVGNTTDITEEGESSPHQAEFEIVWTDGSVQTVPSDSYISVVITDDIA